MDPQTLLDDLRKLANADYNEMPSSWPEIYSAMSEFAEMQQKFHDLDEWLSKGGFVPEDWESHSGAALAPREGEPQWV